VSLFRDGRADRLDPDEPVVAYEELRRSSRFGVLDVGTLACAHCDAPVALGGRAAGPSEPLSCPFCLHTGPLRDFLTLGAPTRPAHVVVRVSLPFTQVARVRHVG
jgi:hypothetical protein